MIPTLLPGLEASLVVLEFSPFSTTVKASLTSCMTPWSGPLKCDFILGMRSDHMCRYRGYSVGTVKLECLLSPQTLAHWTRNGPPRCRGAGFNQSRRVRAEHGKSVHLTHPISAFSLNMRQQILPNLFSHVFLFKGEKCWYHRKSFASSNSLVASCEGFICWCLIRLTTHDYLCAGQTVDINVGRRGDGSFFTPIVIYRFTTWIVIYLFNPPPLEPLRFRRALVSVYHEQFPEE